MLKGSNGGNHSVGFSRERQGIGEQNTIEVVF